MRQIMNSPPARTISEAFFSAVTSNDASIAWAGCLSVVKLVETGEGKLQFQRFLDVLHGESAFIR